MALGQPTFRTASELPALVSYLRERRCVLFVGAGLSRPAGYPDWRTLMQTVVQGVSDQLGDAAGRDELDELLAQGKFAEVADQCRTLLGRTHFGRLLRTILARDVAPPEATHRAIVETPYACIVTTNFDTLLEDAFARWSDFGIPKAPTGRELSQHGTLLLDGAFFILKAHGTIHDDESMVFTSEDYRRITHANPAFQAVMSSLLLTHAVLFVGYSLGDPNFRLLMDSQLSTFGSDAPPRYALMENVGATEKSILRRTAGIEVISFARGAYGEVAGLLQYLAQASADDADPLARREQRAARAPEPSAGNAGGVARGAAGVARGAAGVARGAAGVARGAAGVARGAAGVARGAAGPARGAARSARVLRAGAPDHAFVLRLRARDVMVVCTWYLTHTRDLDGVALPLEAMKTTTSITPSWAALRARIPAAVDAPFSERALDALHEAGDVLAEVAAGVADDLAAAPAGTVVVLDLDPDLSVLPWEWMTVGEWSLALGWPTCRRIPGLPDASRGRPLVRTPLRALLIGDTLAESEWKHRLPAARAEVEGLAALLTASAASTDVTTLTGADASYERVLRELRHGRYDVVHFAGVSHYDESGSYLMLHDGKVGASELVTLLIKRPPSLLVLNALYSGFVPAFCQAFPVPLREGTSYDDHYRALRRHRIGFERSAARAGVGTFVGAMGLTSDDGAGRVAHGFYEALLSGASAAQALHQGRRRAHDAARAAHGGRGDTTVLQLTMCGYADLRLVPPGTTARDRTAPRAASRGLPAADAPAAPTAPARAGQAAARRRGGSRRSRS